MGQVLRDVTEEAFVEAYGFGSGFDDDFYPCCTQHGGAFSADAWVGVFTADDNTSDACIDKCLRAGWGLAVVGAGFERYIGRCAACRIASLLQRFGFCMWAATIRRATNTNDVIVFDKDAADAGVRPCAAKAARSKAGGVEEEGKIVARGSWLVTRVDSFDL